MKILLMRIKMKLGMYEVVKYIHKGNPMYSLITSLLKKQIKKTKAIKLDDLIK